MSSTSESTGESMAPRQDRRGALAESAYLAGSFCVAFVLVALRQPKYLLSPQFYADDGARWFAQAHNLGYWQALVVPHRGYPRLGRGCWPRFWRSSRPRVGAAPLRHPRDRGDALPASHCVEPLRARRAVTRGSRPSQSSTSRFRTSRTCTGTCRTRSGISLFSPRSSSRRRRPRRLALGRSTSASSSSRA